MMCDLTPYEKIEQERLLAKVANAERIVKAICRIGDNVIAALAETGDKASAAQLADLTATMGSMRMGIEELATLAETDGDRETVQAALVAARGVEKKFKIAQNESGPTD